MRNQFFSKFQIVYSEKPSVTLIERNDSFRLAPWLLGDKHVTSYHYHNAFEIGYCFEGNGFHYTPSGKYPFEAGDALFILPKRPHYTVSAPDTVSKWMFLYFDLEAMLHETFGYPRLSNADSLNLTLTLYDYISRDTYPQICDCILQLIHQYQSFLPNRNEILCFQFLQLLYTIRRVQGSYMPCETRTADNYGKMTEIVQYIYQCTESGHIPRMEELSAHFNMSVSNFRKNFREEVGMAPHDFIMKVTIEHTQKLLLSSDMRILDICTAAGFQSISSFNRNFTALCGISPQTYRKIHKTLY